MINAARVISTTQEVPVSWATVSCTPHYPLSRNTLRWAKGQNERHVHHTGRLACSCRAKTPARVPFRGCGCYHHYDGTSSGKMWKSRALRCPRHISEILDGKQVPISFDSFNGQVTCAGDRLLGISVVVHNAAAGFVDSTGGRFNYHSCAFSLPGTGQHWHEQTPVRSGRAALQRIMRRQRRCH
jgi:hypothetical protein